MSKDLHIRVVRSGTICRASIVVHGIDIVAGEATVHEQNQGDSSPEKRAVARAINYLQLLVVQDIRYSDHDYE